MPIASEETVSVHDPFKVLRAWRTLYTHVGLHSLATHRMPIASEETLSVHDAFKVLRAWRTLYTHCTFTGYPKKWQHARCYNPYKWSIQTCWLITGQKKLYTHRTFTGYLLYPCRQPVRIWPLLPIHTVRHIRHKHSRRPAAGRHLRRWNAAIFRTQCSKDAVRFSAFDSSWARRKHSTSFCRHCSSIDQLLPDVPPHAHSMSLCQHLQVNASGQRHGILWQTTTDQQLENVRDRIDMQTHFTTLWPCAMTILNSGSVDDDGLP